MVKIILYIIITVIVLFIFFALASILSLITLFLCSGLNLTDNLDAFSNCIKITAMLILIHYFFGIPAALYSLLFYIAIISWIISVIFYFNMKSKYIIQLSKIVNKIESIIPKIADAKIQVKNTVSDHLANIGPSTGQEIIDANDFSFYNSFLNYKTEIAETLKSDFPSYLNDSSAKTENADSAAQENENHIDCIDNMAELPDLKEIVLISLENLVAEGDIILKTQLNENGRTELIDMNLYESTRGEPIESETLNFDEL